MQNYTSNRGSECQSSHGGRFVTALLGVALFIGGKMAWDYLERATVGSRPKPPTTRTVVAEDDWSITYKITDYDRGQSEGGRWIPTSTYSTVEKVRSSK